MESKTKKLFITIVSCLIVFVISTAILLGFVIYNNKENNHHKKYIELLSAIQYYDYYSVNEIYSLIGDLKDSKYYNTRISFVKSAGTTTINNNVFASVREIQETTDKIRDAKYKTEWSLDSKERFDSFLALCRIDGGLEGFKFTKEFYNGNEFSEGINLFTALGNIEWSDNNGNKLTFVTELNENSHTPQADKLVITLGGREITSFYDDTKIIVANIIRDADIQIQCNKDTTADNFKIKSIVTDSNGNGNWYMTIEEIVSENEINEYVLTHNFN